MTTSPKKPKRKARYKIMYKLTDENMQTYGGTEWVLHEQKTAPGTGNLCTDGWIHVYDDPILATIFNPRHADFKKPRLFKCHVSGRVLGDRGRKFGVEKCTLVKEMALPNISLDFKIEFGIRCALKVYKKPNFVNWAEKWLSGKDRSKSAADAAAYAADADDAAAAAAAAAAYAADAAAAAAAYAAAAAAAAAAYAALNFKAIIKMMLAST